MIFKCHLLLDSTKTLKFWKNELAKRITMIGRCIIGTENPQMKNGLVQSDWNKSYSDAILIQVICDVFEAKTKYFKGNIFSSVVNNSDLLSRYIP